MSMAMTEEDIMKWKAAVRPIPLESYHTPVGGSPLADMSDEVLMKCPPHMIAHIQRTAAQGGLQIISPRQIPFSQLMLRTMQPRRQLGDHIVGSIAVATDEWPTIDDADMSDLLPDEPLPPISNNPALRMKTRASPVTKATYEMSDPILKCLVTGRAVVDILRRDDVQGGADEFIEVLAKAWGINRVDIEDLDAFTLGHAGQLLRHAIKVDEVYPTMYAPIQVKRCISVGASEVSRNYLPADSAMDWRRMRVFAEAVFTLTCSIEGHPIKYMACYPPPGDSGAPGDRAGVMCFQPAPASAWTFEAVTFSIMPNAPCEGMSTSAIPQEVLAALARHVKVVRPLSYVMTQGFVASARKSVVVPADVPPDETIRSSYNVLVSTMSLGAGRGKTAVNSVRNVVYTTIEAASLHVRLRIARYIYLAADECRIHLQLSEVPDSVVMRLAKRFLTIGDTIRHRVAEEASRRGSTLEEWWHDILSQTPMRYKVMLEGTMGWAMVTMWLLFRENTSKWRKLATAVHYTALRDVEKNAIASVPLPATVGSVERVTAACKAAVKGITTAYCGYYKGVSDVGISLAEAAEEMGRVRTAATLREASYLWVLRARCFRGTNVDVLAKGGWPRSKNHFLVRAEPNNLAIVPAPYKAFGAYRTHLLASTVVHTSFKTHISVHKEIKISDIFKMWTSPICPAKESTLTRYLVTPNRLHRDMEDAWSMLTDDIQGIASKYSMEGVKPEPGPETKKPKMMEAKHLVLPVKPPPAEGVTYWELLADIDTDQVEWIEELLERLGPGYEELYTDMTYVDATDLVRQMIELDRKMPQQEDKARESVH